MKKFLCYIAAAVLVLCVGGCESESVVKNDETEAQPTEVAEQKTMEGVFRYANWGDSIDTIAEKEDAEFSLRDETLLLYKDMSLLNYDTDVAYYFDSNGFKAGIYTITDIHSNENSYIDDYKDINEALIEKYGEPAIDKENWIRDLLKSDPGLALGYGDVEYASLWNIDNLQIMHKLSGDNFEIKHIIFYGNPNNKSETDTTGL